MFIRVKKVKLGLNCHYGLIAFLVKKELEGKDMTWEEFLRKFQGGGIVKKSMKNVKATKGKPDQKRKSLTPQTSKASKAREKKTQSKKLVLEKELEPIIETSSPSRRLNNSCMKKRGASSRGGHTVSTSPINIYDSDEHSPSADRPQSNSPIKDTLPLLVDATIHFVFSVGCGEEEDNTPLATLTKNVNKRKKFHIHSESARKEPTMDQAKGTIPQSLRHNVRFPLMTLVPIMSQLLKGFQYRMKSIRKTLLSICIVRSKN